MVGVDSPGAATDAAEALAGVVPMGAARVATAASLCLLKTSSLVSQEAAEREVRLLSVHTHSGQRKPPSEK